VFIWLDFPEKELFAVSFRQQIQLCLFNLSCDFDFCIAEAARIIPVRTAEKKHGTGTGLDCLIVLSKQF
jgi:hypothetical protein